MTSSEKPPFTSKLVAGRYELERIAGSGGMGAVWVARDVKLQREVAVKLLSPRLAAKPEVKERFEAEALAAGRLNHPNVVQVYDTGEHEGVPFIVMELLSGRTLAHELSGGPLEAPRVLQIGQQVLAGLGAAHQAGIVHRDVKPANILFTSGGEEIKVADFGIAKSTEGLDITQTGDLLGTPAYLAPERLAGRPATLQSDLYSLGVVLYEALAGKRAFAGDNVMRLIWQIQNDPAPSLLEARPDLDPGVSRVIERAMAKDPGQRYQSAADMAQALSTAARATPASADEIDSPTVALPPKARSLDETQVLRRQETGLEGPDEPVVTARPAPWLRRGALAAGVAVVVLLLVAVLAASDLFGRFSGPGEPSPTAASQGPPLPQPLESSMRRLEQAVRP